MGRGGKEREQGEEEGNEAWGGKRMRNGRMGKKKEKEREEGKGGRELRMKCWQQKRFFSVVAVVKVSVGGSRGSSFCWKLSSVKKG